MLTMGKLRLISMVLHKTMARKGHWAGVLLNAGVLSEVEQGSTLAEQKITIDWTLHR